MEHAMSLKGIDYLVDSAGHRKAVVIDLERWGELWEDFYDALAAEERRNEPTVSWDALKAEMAAEGIVA